MTLRLAAGPLPWWPETRDPAPTRLAAKQEGQVKAAVLAAYAEAALRVDGPALRAAAEAGHEEGLLAALRLSVARDLLLARVMPRLRTCVVAGAQLGAEEARPFLTTVGRALAGTVAKREPLGAALDAVNPEAVAWAQAHAAALVVASDEIRRQIRDLVVASQAHRITVDELARQVRRLIGLDARRMAAVAAFEERLRAAGVAGQVLARRVDRYAAAQLRARALLIARTETIAALAHGQQALWSRAVKDGLLVPDVLGKVWVVTDDERLCPWCENLGESDPVGIDEPFAGGISGPPAHPACRCATGLRKLTEEERRRRSQ